MALAVTVIGWDAQGRPIEDTPPAVRAWDANGNPVQAEPPSPPRRTPWTPAERQAVAQDTARRYQLRGLAPMGLGAVTEPLTNMLTDPRQRAALGRNIQGALNLAAQVPSLNLPRLANDTMAAGQRAWNAAPGAIWNAITHPIDTLDAMTLRPFRDNDEARNQEIVTAMRGNEAGANRAAEQAVGSTGGIVTNTAGAALGPLVRGPVSGAALAMGLTAPNAIANGQGSLQERLPQAAVDTAGAGVLGGGLALLARNPRPATVASGSGSPHGMASAATPASRMADFEAAGVRPTAAGVLQGSAADVTKTITENWLGGPFARAGLRASIADTAQQARNLAQRVGTVQEHEVAGEGVQAGVGRFASEGHEPIPAHFAGMDPRAIPTHEWSWRTKANVLYDRSLRPYEAAPATASNTQNTLASFANEARITPDPAIRQLTDVLAQRGNTLTLENLRTLREDVRMAQDPRNLTQTRNNAHLQQLESALTRDIYDAVRQAGGESAVHALRQTDRYYATGMSRINNALKHFSEGSEGRPISGATVYQRIIQAARVGGSQNTPRLQALARSLRPDELRTVSASLLDEMGAPRAGRPGALEPNAFSVTTFANEWARLSETGKNILFPPALRRELDALARVADYQREVEAMANNSRTSLRTQNYVTTGGAAAAVALHNPVALGGAAAVLGGMNLTGAMLVNPTFVRLLVRSATARASRAGAGRWLAELRRAAMRDPALIPAYNNLVRAQPASAPDRQEQLQPAQ